MSNLLKQVTYKTLKKLKNFDIVLPMDYTSTFKKNALDVGLPVDDDKILLEYLNQDLNKIDSIYSQTNESLEVLKNSTNNAYTAIANNDKNELERIKHDIIMLQDKVMFLQMELFTDSLTKAYNRKWFNDHFLNKDKFKTHGVIGFLDLNNFKSINDTYGHIVGDMVLKYLVDFLKKNIKTGNFYVVRYAGDEFLIIFENYKDVNSVNRLCGTLQQKLLNKTLTPKHDKSVTFSFTFSYGVAFFKENELFETTLKVVDEKMYDNKKDYKKS